MPDQHTDAAGTGLRQETCGHENICATPLVGVTLYLGCKLRHCRTDNRRTFVDGASEALHHAARMANCRAPAQAVLTKVLQRARPETTHPAGSRVP